MSENNGNKMRLQKFLAECGIASRRKSEEIILQGRIKVNGNIITKLGTQIDEDKDIIELDNKKIKREEKKIYILLNKPIGYVTTVHEQFGRDKVTDLIKVKERIVPVGRLDMYTSGALILTNDGEFVYKVTHPSKEINKTYTVTLRGDVTQEEIESLRNGVYINNGEYKTKKAKARIIKVDKEKNITRLEIIIHEGKNRQVRKMCEAIGKKVIALHRTKIGNISVKGMKIGEWRFLTKEEILSI